MSVKEKNRRYRVLEIYSQVNSIRITPIDTAYIKWHKQIQTAF
ncbi:MAG: hypothetical protein ACI88H_000627 [Cocleimonas sp.]|jgi:hypothetical protein